MQSAQAMALNELNRIRSNNSAELERRRSEVRSRSDEYSGIEADLMRAGNSLLRSVLYGNKDFEKIKSYIQNKQKDKQRILCQLGLPENYLDEIYCCQNCHDTGFDEDGRKCFCLKELTAKYIDYNSNMTELMKSQTFENFDFSLFSPVPAPNGRAQLDIAKAAFDAAERFADNFEKGGSILLKGNVGTGKTYLSSCIGNRALDRGKTVYYQTAYKLCELLENIKFGKYDTAEEYEQAQGIQKYAENADLLIIDDLGTEFLTQFTAAALFDLINTRLMKGKASVISTNLDFAALENRYSSRFTSRIIGDYTIITTAPDDLRKKHLK